MDFERPTQPMEPYQPAQPPQHYGPVSKGKPKGKKFMMWLLILVLMAGAGAAGYFYRDMEAKDQQKESDAAVASLRAENTQLKADLAASTTANEAARQPSEQDLAIIKAAVEADKYSNIQPLMTDKVTVVLAASESGGEKTPEEAVADMKFLDDAQDPWNFALATTTLDGYRLGDYAKYFPQSALVGQSKDGYVVAFGFDETSGKVNSIFITGDAKLLTKVQQ